MKLNNPKLILLTVYAVVIFVGFFVPQLHLSKNFLYIVLPLAVVFPLVTPIIAKHSSVYWPLTFVYVCCNVAYYVFYPLCLFTGNLPMTCQSPDAIRWSFLIDHLSVLFVFIVHNFSSSRGWRDKIPLFFFILFAGPLGFLLSTNGSNGGAKFVGKKEKIFTNIFWLIIAILSSVAVGINFAWTDPSSTGADNFPIPYALDDPSFGYLITFLVNEPTIILVGHLSLLIDRYDEKSWKKWMFKILLTFVMQINMASGVCMAIIFHLI